MNKGISLIPDGSRREFLKTTAAAVAGLGVSGAITPAVHAAGDETLKVALIGCGNRGTGALVQALSTSGPVKLWALADTFQEQIDRLLPHVERELKGEQTERRKGKSAKHKAVAAAGRIDCPKERQFVGLDAY